MFKKYIKKSITGVYEIKNIQNNKRYIGSSSNIDRRWREHKTLLIQGNHINNQLQTDWNNSGEINFEFNILEITSKENKLIREQYYIERYKTYNSEYGYNKRRKNKIKSVTSCNFTITQKLKEIRLRNNLTLKQLSAISNVSYAYISDIENNKKCPTIDFVLKLCYALNCSVEDIFRINICNKNVI